MVSQSVKTTVLVLAFLLLISAMSVKEASATLKVQKRTTGLTTAGGRVVDFRGNVVILRGVNMYGYQSGYWWGHQESDYVLIASWGFNVVRLPIAWSYIEPTLGHYDDSYFSNYVDRDIEWAQRNSIYVMLDMHQDGWSPYFTFPGWPQNGFPAWAVSEYPNTKEGQRQAILDFWNGLGPSGSQPSASNPSLQDRLAAAWQHVASRYTGNAVIVGFDLFNEPPTVGLENFGTEKLPAFYTKMIDAVRSADPNRICVWEADSRKYQTTPPDRPNLVYSTHYPGGGIDSYEGITALEADVESELSASQSWGMPLFIGEWGVVYTYSALAQYINDNLALYDQYGIGSAWWAYSREGDFGMYLFDGHNNLRTSITNCLVRPYLVGYATPASVVSSHFDTSALTLQVQLQSVGQLPLSVPSTFSIKMMTNIASTTTTGKSTVSVLPVDQASSISVQF
jgi:hypothetical protein